MTMSIMRTENPYRLHLALGYQLTLTSRLQERRFEDQIRTLGLTRISWCILLAVETEELNRPSDIADFVGIDRTATSRALRQMENAGMLRRKSGDADRRTTCVEVTERGAGLLGRATDFARANATHFENKLSAPEALELRRLLEKLRIGEETRLRRL